MARFPKNTNYYWIVCFFLKLLARFPRKNEFMIRIFDIPRSGRSLFPPKAHPGPPRASSGPGLGQGEIWVGPGVTEFTVCCKKQWFLQIWNSPPDPPDPADQVSGAAVQDLPSTRAGGQDDVSSKQTPSKNRGVNQPCFRVTSTDFKS